MIPIELKAGSCLFFNYQLIHGSSSNASEFQQLRMIVQLLKKENNRDVMKNQNVWKKRNLKEISILQKIINLKKKLGQAVN